MQAAWATLISWPPRRWRVAALGGVAVALLVALPTAVIPNPVFGRSVEVTWWSYPVVLITAVLGGLLLATYVKVPEGQDSEDSQGAEVTRGSVLGMVGGFVSFFAVGCPVCNKLVLLALGASGAIAWFAPVQPYLAVASILMMAFALAVRLRGQMACSTR